MKMQHVTRRRRFSTHVGITSAPWLDRVTGSSHSQCGQRASVGRSGSSDPKSSRRAVRVGRSVGQVSTPKHLATLRVLRVWFPYRGIADPCVVDVVCSKSEKQKFTMLHIQASLEGILGCAEPRACGLWRPERAWCRGYATSYASC